MRRANMPLRKMKQKRFSGVYEYYRKSDPDKATVAYYISVRDADGMPKKIKTDAKTPEGAVVLLAQYKAHRPKESNRSDNPIKTFDELAREFFKHRTTSNNHKEMRRYERYIEPVLGKVKLSSIKKRHLLNLQEILKAKKIQASPAKDAPLVPMQPKTVNLITDIAYRILRWGYDREIVTTLPPRIEKLKVDNERQRILTEQELQALFDAVDGEDRLFLMLAYYTAQRPESILRLKHKHVLPNDMLLIESIKGQTSHVIPIAKKLQEALYPWIEGLEPECYILTKSHKRLPYNTISNRLNKVFRQLFNQGLDPKLDAKQWVSIYTLRHTALTHIYAKTSDIYAAQAIANHSSLQMTQRYAKMSESLKRNAVDVL